MEERLKEDDFIKYYEASDRSIHQSLKNIDGLKRGLESYVGSTSVIVQANKHLEFLSPVANMRNNLNRALELTNEIRCYSTMLIQAENAIREPPGDELASHFDAIDKLQYCLEFFETKWSFPDLSLKDRIDNIIATICSSLDRARIMLIEKFEAKTKSLSMMPKDWRMEEIDLLRKTVSKLIPVAHAQCFKKYSQIRADVVHGQVEIALDEPDNGWDVMGNVLTIFAEEREACHAILQGVDSSLLDSCFSRIISKGLEKVLRACEKCKKPDCSTLNIFGQLVLSALHEFKTEIDRLFESSSGPTLESLEDMMEAFAAIVFAKISQTPETFVQDDYAFHSSEKIHLIAYDVFTYIRDFLRHEENLKFLISKYKYGGLDCEFNFTSILKIVAALQKRLEVLANNCNEDGQSYIFLVNNAQFIVTEINEIEKARQLFGEDWISAQRNYVDEMANAYINTWLKVTSAIPSGVLGFLGATTVKDSLNLFKSKFEEKIGKDHPWIVHDAGLCQRIRNGVADVVVPVYKSFWEQQSSLVEGLRGSRRKSRWYTPEEIKTEILETLFSGEPHDEDMA